MERRGSPRGKRRIPYAFWREGHSYPEIAEEASPAQAEESEIEIIVCDDPEPSPPAETPAAPEAPLATAASCDEPAPPPAAENGDAADEPEPVEWDLEGEVGLGHPEALYRSEALLIDDGELDDVHAMLEALGVDPVRHAGITAEGFRDWEKPPRVVVVSARAASRLTVSTRSGERKIATIAVAEADSRTLSGMLRRQGFDYVVRRPVHPEALRLLLMTALYRGAERRSQPRLPFGCAVATRWGILRHPATLLDLSSCGCRFLGRETLEPATRVSVRIPGEVAGGRGLTLRGRVQRSERPPGQPPEAGALVALRFDALSQRTQGRLETLLAACASGPPALPRAAEQASRAPRAPAPPAGVQEVSGESRRAPRRHPRASFEREVVALDAQLERVRHVLFARDLCAGGVRVDPHPELQVGDRFGLVLYDATYSESVVVDAEVLRDDGGRGLALRFVDVPAHTARKIERILQRVGEIERCDARGNSESVIVAEVVEANQA